MASSPFAISSKDYIHNLALDWLSRYWAIVVLPIAATLIWACFDLRALYVCLIIIFIIYPMAMTLVWFNYALSPNAVKAISPKCVSVLDSGLQIDFITDDDRPRIIRPQFIPWENISSAIMTDKSIVIIFGKRLDERLKLPSDAFSDSEWHSIVNHLHDRLPSDESL